MDKIEDIMKELGDIRQERVKSKIDRSQLGAPVLKALGDVESENQSLIDLQRMLAENFTTYDAEAIVENLTSIRQILENNFATLNVLGATSNLSKSRYYGDRHENDEGEEAIDEAASWTLPENTNELRAEIARNKANFMYRNSKKKDSTITLDDIINKYEEALRYAETTEDGDLQCRILFNYAEAMRDLRSDNKRQEIRQRIKDKGCLDV